MPVCSITQPDDRLALVRSAVRFALKQLSPAGQAVTLGTLLGPGGLGHGPSTRRRYHALIRQKLAEKAFCETLTLTPQSYVDPKLIFVRDIDALVLADLN
jgi:hypothetical protein